jgi:hypothetical protein
MKTCVMWETGPTGYSGTGSCPARRRGERFLITEKMQAVDRPQISPVRAICDVGDLESFSEWRSGEFCHSHQRPEPLTLLKNRLDGGKPENATEHDATTSDADKENLPESRFEAGKCLKGVRWALAIEGVAALCGYAIWMAWHLLR